MPHSCDHRAPSFRKRESWLGWQFVIRLDLLFISSALGSALAGAEPHLCCTLTGREPANTCHFYRSTRISGDDNVGVWENIHMCVFTWDWRTSKLCMCVCVEWIFPIGKFFFFFFSSRKRGKKELGRGVIWSVVHVTDLFHRHLALYYVVRIENTLVMTHGIASCSFLLYFSFILPQRKKIKKENFFFFF